MNNFFKPILLTLAFAVSMLSFSNQSYANCSISGITLGSTNCTGSTYSATFMVNVNITGGAATYGISVNVNNGAFSGSVTGQTSGGMVAVTVNNISDPDGMVSVSATLNGDCSGNFGPVNVSGTPTDCGSTCNDCMPNGTLTVSNTGGSGSEICGSNSFQAQSIVSDGAITGSRMVTFTASNSITLNAGFQSNTTGTFTATIGSVTCATLTDENGEEGHRLAVGAGNISVGAAVKVTPNPFSSSASIDYTLENEGQVIIQVFNLKGEPVATLMNGTQVAGQHTVNFEATNLPKGFYYLSLQTATERVTEQMVIMR